MPISKFFPGPPGPRRLPPWMGPKCPDPGPTSVSARTQNVRIGTDLSDNSGPNLSGRQDQAPRLYSGVLLPSTSIILSPETTFSINHQTKMMIVTRPSRARTSLNDRIDALKANTTEGSPTKRVFDSVRHIFALILVRTGILHFIRSICLTLLVKNKKARNGDSVQLSESCVSLCETLKAAIQGKDTGDLDESERTAVEDSERWIKCVVLFTYLTNQL